MASSPCKLPIGSAGEIVAMVIHTSLAIGGSLGNILIILVIYRTPRLKTVCGVLITNVAVADLMITSIVMPILVFTLVQGFLKQCFYWISDSAFLGRCFAINAYNSKYGPLLRHLQTDKTQDNGDTNKNPNYYRENVD